MMKMYLFKKEYWKDWWENMDDNLYWKSYRFVKYTLIPFFKYDIKYGVKNLIVYFPVIWNNREWDYLFLYKLMEKKLQRMEYNIRTYGHHVGNEKDANRIKECHEIITRLLADDYFGDNFEKDFTEKYGELDHFFTKVEDKPNLCQWNSDFTKTKTKEEQEEANTEWHRLYKLAEEMKQKEKRKLFRKMATYIESWWD